MQTWQRTLLLVLLMLSAASRADSASPEAAWQTYQARYIEASGRVVDSGNGNISHSEGQGFAMLLAVYFHNRALFDTLWHWTQTHLQVREDALFAWRWEPEAGQATDRNNASDGDLLIAWALFRAADAWQHPAYTEAALAIGADIHAKLLHSGSHGLVLLPGEHGFVHEDDGTTTLNLSYWVFPALQALQQHDTEHADSWRTLLENGLSLLEHARFGRWQLPPDWLRTTDPLKPEEILFKPRFGYDAIRVPLYLIWAGLADQKRLQAFLDFHDFFASAPFIPAWTDLNNDSVDSYQAPAGIRAVMALARLAVGRQDAAWPPAEQAKDYYALSLWLLCAMARQDVHL